MKHVEDLDMSSEIYGMCEICEICEMTLRRRISREEHDEDSVLTCIKCPARQCEICGMSEIYVNV